MSNLSEVFSIVPALDKMQNLAGANKKYFGFYCLCLNFPLRLLVCHCQQHRKPYLNISTCHILLNLLWRQFHIFMGSYAYQKKEVEEMVRGKKKSYCLQNINMLRNTEERWWELIFSPTWKMLTKCKWGLCCQKSIYHETKIILHINNLKSFLIHFCGIAL